MKSRKKRSIRPQPADGTNRRPPRKSERAIARERYVHDDRQADRPRRPQPQIDISPRLPRPGGRGNKSKQANREEPGRGGVGRKEKDNEKARGHEHLIISSPALLISSKHRTTHQPPPHSMNPHDAPAAIASRSKQPPIAVSHRSRSRLRRHPFEAVGRRWQQRHAIEAQQIDHGHGITSKARHANVPRRRHDTIEASKQPRRLPVPRHDKRGEEAGRRGANRGKAKRMTMGNIAER